MTLGKNYEESYRPITFKQPQGAEVRLLFFLKDPSGEKIPLAFHGHLRDLCIVRHFFTQDVWLFGYNSKRGLCFKEQESCLKL